MDATIIPFPSKRDAPGESIEELTQALAALLDLVDETAHKLATRLERETGELRFELLREQVRALLRD